MRRELGYALGFALGFAAAGALASPPKAPKVSARTMRPKTTSSKPAPKRIVSQSGASYTTRDEALTRGAATAAPAAATAPEANALDPALVIAQQRAEAQKALAEAENAQVRHQILTASVATAQKENDQFAARLASVKSYAAEVRSDVSSNTSEFEALARLQKESRRVCRAIPDNLIGNIKKNLGIANTASIVGTAGAGVALVGTIAETALVSAKARKCDAGEGKCWSNVENTKNAAYDRYRNTAVEKRNEQFKAEQQEGINDARAAEAAEREKREEYCKNVGKGEGEGASVPNVEGGGGGGVPVMP